MNEFNSIINRLSMASRWILFRLFFLDILLYCVLFFIVFITFFFLFASSRNEIYCHSLANSSYGINKLTLDSLLSLTLTRFFFLIPLKIGWRWIFRTQCALWLNGIDNRRVYRGKEHVKHTLWKSNIFLIENRIYRVRSHSLQSII